MKPNGKSRVLREEVFSPHVVLVPFRDLDEAVRIYNDTEYGLACAVTHRIAWTVNHGRGIQMAQGLKAEVG